MSEQSLLVTAALNILKSLVKNTSQMKDDKTPGLAQRAKSLVLMPGYDSLDLSVIFLLRGTTQQARNGHAKASAGN